ALIHGLTPYSEEVVVTGVVSTPGYPTPMQQGTRFIKLLRAPECHRVRLVVEKLDVYQRIDGRCLVDALAIRTSGRLDQGEIFCGQEISSGREFLSDNTTLILDYVGYDYASSGIVNKRPGFIATVAHVRDPACGVQENISVVSSSPKQNFSADIMAGNCSVELTNSANIFNVRSPGYPAPYQGPVACSLKLHTMEPSYLKVKATEANFSKRDRLIFTLPGGSNYRISSADKNVVRSLISANSDVSFRTMSKSSGVFSVEVEAIASNCHKVRLFHIRDIDY
ncbi:suppressor of lurcher protein 1-like, partial [Hyalella azteca]|uniref:Suppressor of lurcher protein 1-like n=1 Tax=Hyalella azteca TaxID=294128 RepID=A0A8B7P178_HYAAZ